MNPLLDLLALVILGTLVAMIVGMVKPSFVIRWGENKSRPRVLMVYGGLFVVCFITLGIFGTDQGVVLTTVSEKKIEQTKVEAKKVVTEPAKPEVKYNYDQAYKLIYDWLGEHQFPGITSLALSPGKEDGSLYKVYDKEYHLFILDGLSRSVNILVDPNTGEMFYHDIGVKPEPINSWFLKYLQNHKGNQNTRIDKNFEWVEFPHFENGEIVGKIKNISDRSFKSLDVGFTLYDDQGNQVGQAVTICQMFKSGNVWSFRARVLESNASKFEFDGIGY